MAAATASVNGYLTSADWTTFNSKGSGSVTSVAATVPSFLSVSGSPITTSGTLALTYSGTALPVANGGTGVTASSGANSVVLRDASVNISVNSIIEGYSNVAAAGTTTTLTVVSVPNYVVTGSGGQTYQLPDATTLANGVNYTFNNNQSSGTIVVKNNSGTTVATIQSGGLVDVSLLSNATAAGSWDVHNLAPSNVSWSTNTFDYPGSITSATWNGVAVAINRGGTGQATATAGFNALSPITTTGDLIIGNGTNSATRLAIGTNGYVLTSNGTTASWSASTGGVTSVTGTSPVVSSGGATPAISMAAATTSVSGYLTSTDWNTFNNKGSGTVTSVSGTTGNITSTGGATPVINLASGVATAGTSGSATLVPVVTIDTYGRVTSITTAANPQGTVTSVTGTSPIASSGGATPALSLSASYGDTQNPYASKTANYVLAAPNGTAGAPTFRAIVAADIPTLNQNTTGTASNVTGTVVIANGGTGATTAAAAFNALSPITTAGDLILGNGTNSATRLGIGSNGYVLTSNGTTASWAATAGGTSLSNDTSTTSFEYPLFAAATTGTASTVYTSNAKLLYKPSTGEFQASELAANNGIFVNATTIASSYTIATGYNAHSVGPVTVASGQAVTISSGQRWLVM
jgi:hypothetical protein